MKKTKSYEEVEAELELAAQRLDTTPTPETLKTYWDTVDKLNAAYVEIA